MCRTPYCTGDCEECIPEDKWNKEWDERASECPYTEDCKLKR